MAKKNPYVTWCYTVVPRLLRVHSFYMVFAEMSALARLLASLIRLFTPTITTPTTSSRAPGLRNLSLSRSQLWECSAQCLTAAARERLRESQSDQQLIMVLHYPLESKTQVIAGAPNTKTCLPLSLWPLTLSAPLFHATSSEVIGKCEPS